MSIELTEYQRGRGDAQRAGIAPYFTTVAHHAGITHLARFACTRAQDAAYRATKVRPEATALTDTEALGIYTGARAAQLEETADTAEAHNAALSALWTAASERGWPGRGAA
jgi:hypothetical protein